MHRRLPATLSTAFRRLRRCERGFGLIELIAVIPMVAATLFATYALYNVAARSQESTTTRVQSLVQQQIGFERMTRELRQSTSVTPVSSQTLDVVTWVRPSNADRSVKRRVRYECLSNACNRWEGPPDGALTSGPVTVITNVQNADVFTMLPTTIDPTYVAIRVEVSVKGATKPIVFDGGIALRNQQNN
jgi:type II secretory pathway pseudopilin PulG